MGNTVTAQYAYGNALIRKDGEYPLFDGLGSERTVTNASQTVTGTVNFDAFGSTVGTSGSSTNPYMYAATSGYRNDGDAGLVHVGARYYDAQVGRWTSRDTVLMEHPYLYCEHSPTNSVDPDGHMPQLVLAAAGGATIGSSVGGGTVVGTVFSSVGAVLSGPVGWVILAVVVVAVTYVLLNKSTRAPGVPWMNRPSPGPPPPDKRPPQAQFDPQEGQPYPWLNWPKPMGPANPGDLTIGPDVPGPSGL